METRKQPETARQKKFLTDIENASDPAGTWRTIKSLFGTPASTIFTEPLLWKARAVATSESHNQRLQLSVACAEDYAAIANGRKSHCAALRREELDEAIYQMRT